MLLTYNKNILLLNLEDGTLGSVHKTFFTSILGFSLSLNEKSYSLNVKREKVAKVLSEIVEYCNSVKLDIKLDQSCVNILGALDTEKRELEEAVFIGTKIKREKLKPLIIPNFKRKLKQYQIAPVKHIVELKKAANFSVPGSGKTTIVYAAYSILKNQKKVDKLLVVGPRSAFMPWEEEYLACFGKKPKILRITGSVTNRLEKYKLIPDYDIFILTYQMLCRDLQNIVSLLKEFNTLIVLDESHYIKKIEYGQWSEAVLSIAPYSEYKIVLTGTPMPNKVTDLWAQMTFLWSEKNLFGERERFKYLNSSQRNLKSIREKIGPLYYRIKKSDLDLPKQHFVRLKVPMKKCQRAIYQSISEKFLTELIKEPEERIKLRDWRKARVIRLLEAATNPTLLSKFSHEFNIPPLDSSGLSVSKLIEKYPKFERPTKFDVLEQVVAKLVSKKKKVVIWTNFIHNIKMAEKILRKYKPLIVHGGIAKDETENAELNREKIISSFKNKPNKLVLIANPAACAESVSLHSICKDAIYFDRTFNGAHYMQSLDRIHRIGLKKTDIITYYLLISKDTIDEVIDSRLNEKYSNMLELLEGDLSISGFDLDQQENETEEEKDFKAVINFMKRDKNDRKT